MPMKIGDALPKFEGASDWVKDFRRKLKNILKAARRSFIFGRQAAESAKVKCRSYLN